MCAWACTAPEHPQEPNICGEMDKLSSKWSPTRVNCGINNNSTLPHCDSAICTICMLFGLTSAILMLTHMMHP